MPKRCNPETDPILSKIFPRFNELIVLSQAEPIKTKNQRYAASLCRCDCGNIKIIRNDYLKSLRAKTCGCKRGNFTHGLADTPIYYSWENMKKRCLDAKNEKYPIYGGRGIIICARWLKSFEHFYADMGDKPSRHHQIDRIDNDGNYEPENCHWATRKEQMMNRSVTIYATYNGVKKTLTEWAEISGLKYVRIYQRIYRNNWSVEKALTTPTVNSPLRPSGLGE